MMGAVQRRISILGQALTRLDEALDRPEDPIVRDACIQRFEFTFEMAWKAVQAQAMAEGLECVSPRDCFRTAFQLGLVEHDTRGMAMVEDRNRTAHTYDEKAAPRNLLGVARLRSNDAPPAGTFDRALSISLGRYPGFSTVARSTASSFSMSIVASMSFSTASKSQRSLGQQAHRNASRSLGPIGKWMATPLCAERSMARHSMRFSWPSAAVVCGVGSSK